MNKMLAATIIVLLSSINLFAHWEVKVTGNEIDFKEVRIFDETNAVAIGDEGATMWTENGGTLWVQKNINLPKNCSNI